MNRESFIARIKAGMLCSTGHINYGAGKGGGYPSQHTTEPRLSVIDRTQMKPARVFLVDGVQVADFDAAIDALLVPAVLTEAETAMLERVPAEWAEVRALRRTLAGIGEAEDTVMIAQTDPRAAVIEVMHWLGAKGMLEYREWTEPRTSGPHSQPSIARISQIRRRPS